MCVLVFWQGQTHCVLVFWRGQTSGAGLPCRIRRVDALSTINVGVTGGASLASNVSLSFWCCVRGASIISIGLHRRSSCLGKTPCEHHFMYQTCHRYRSWGSKCRVGLTRSSSEVGRICKSYGGVLDVPLVGHSCATGVGDSWTSAQIIAFTRCRYIGRREHGGGDGGRFTYVLQPFSNFCHRYGRVV